MVEARDLYLDLVKKAVLKAPLYPQADAAPLRPTNIARRLVLSLLARRGFTLARMTGPQGLTFLTEARLDNIRARLETVIEERVPGDLIETGVWRGGAAVYMRAILTAHNITDRTLYLADSFQGLPETPELGEDDPRYFPWPEGGQFAVSRAEPEGALARFGLSENVVFVEGWFADTLPALQGHEWAFIHLDGDTYESTMDALKNLYPGLQPGGVVVIDDYGDFGACSAAVDDYRREHGVGI
jgi:O-methyltransferase